MSPQTTPHTTFAGGVNPFIFNPKAPKRGRQMNAKASTKTLPADECYSTPYQTPASADPAAPAVYFAAAAPLPAAQPLPQPHRPALLPDLDAIQIDNDVPLPEITHRPDAVARNATLRALLGKLQPKQSAALPYGVYASLNKLLAATHKTGAARYATRKDKTTQTLRVWRVA